jgi:hypothetical protein
MRVCGAPSSAISIVDIIATIIATIVDIIVTVIVDCYQLFPRVGKTPSTGEKQSVATVTTDGPHSV